jgi:hypothetical protein
LLELADAPVADEFAGEPEAVVAALLAPGLEHGLVLAHGLHQPLALIDRQRERLLAIDILSRLHSRQVHNVCQ